MRDTSVGLALIDKTDQISERRANTESAGNPYAPESLITGAETIAGLTYHDHRHWPTLRDYKAAVAGRMTSSQIEVVAPRVKGNKFTTVGHDKRSIEEAIRLDGTAVQEIAPGITVVSLDALASGSVTL